MRHNSIAVITLTFLNFIGRIVSSDTSDNKLRLLNESLFCQTDFCGLDSCNRFGSRCSQDNKCSCFSGWVTSPTSKKLCCYKQYIQTTAFLYELFLGFGAGHFYCERNLNAGFKLAFLIATISAIMIMSFIKSNLSLKDQSTDKVDFAQRILLILFIIFWVSWQIGDAIMFGTNQHKDGNNIQLEAW